MFSIGPRAKRSRHAVKPRSALAVALLCLAMLLPALPMQPVAAAPSADQPASLRAQQPDQPLIAFLRQGNLWLMNADGSNARQITEYPEGVTRYSWSPSGQYIALQHGGRFWHYTLWRIGDPPPPMLALYNVATGELRELTAMPAGVPYPASTFPSWAANADTLLMEISEGNGTYSIVRMGLDGVTTPLATYSLRPTCGGPDGPMTITRDLLWEQEFGSPFARNAYQGMIWWGDREVAYVNTECGQGIALNLATSAITEYPNTVWLAAGPDGRILTQGTALVGGGSAGVFDPATGTTTPIDSANVLAWGPAGEITSTTVTEGAESGFTSIFDDLPSRYRDNTVEIWHASGQGGKRQRIASLDVYGTGVPTVGSDGSIVVGAIDNPTALMDVDQSQYGEYAPGIFAAHQRVLRIEPSGSVTVLATNAYRPRLQPVSIPVTETPASSDEPSDPTGTPERIGTPTQPTAQPPDVAGDGWVAFVGEDGNIWLMRPDGSDARQITADGTTQYGVSTYQAPVWSPDGTVLVFRKSGAPDAGIMVYRDGMLTRVAGTERCGPAAITLDTGRLLYSCAGSGVPYDPDPTDDQLRSDPALAAIADSNLDGSDARVLVPYASMDSSQNGIPWVDSGLVGFNGLYDLAVNASTGEILATFGFLHSRTAWLVDADVASSPVEIPFSDSNQDRLGPFSADFIPSSEHIVALVCERGCYPPYEDQARSIVILNRDGSIDRWLIDTDTMSGLGDFTVSPDGTTLMLETSSTSGDASSMLWSMPIGEGATPVRSGSSPAWQPVAAAIALPDGSADGAATTMATSAADPVESSASTGSTDAVPQPFIATWSGTGVQVNPAVEWPVTLTVTGGGAGEVVGTSDYPNQACGGELILREATADSIVMTEQLTYGQDSCTGGGTITLSGIENVAVQFAWSGTRADGGASSASGRLFRSDSAESTSDAAGGGSASPSGTENGPVVDTTHLHAYYIGTWSGTGVQANPTSEWPITVTFTGGGPGEVIGTVEYPTLGCGGDLILDAINPNDEWLGFQVTERITYGQDACIDGGTFRFSSESAEGILFSWESSASATTARGVLGAAGLGSSSGPPAQSVDVTGVEPVETNASGGGPPSIDDDPEAEPVPIEPEGGA